MSPAKASERQSWAVEVMGVKPNDTLLEIGCGYGVAVSLVCAKLDGGHIIAVDRSPKMIEHATRRNAEYIERGLASVQTAALHEADLGSSRFDKIFAIHVPVFLRGNPDRDLEIIRARLVPGGSFFLPYQSLVPEQANSTAQLLSAKLDRNGFTVTDVVIENLSSGRVGCVIAR